MAANSKAGAQKMKGTQGSVYRQRTKPDGMSKEQWDALSSREKDEQGVLVSQNWYYSFYSNGKLVRKSAKSDKITVAKMKLQRDLAKVSRGEYSSTSESITVADLVEAFFAAIRTGVRNKGLKSLDDSEARWRLHLAPFFGSIKAANLTTDFLTRYVEARQKEGVGPATLNREFALVKAAMNYGMKSEPPKITRVPQFPKFRENNIRKGFLRDVSFDKLAAECAKAGLWLRAMFEVAVTFGWRLSEVRNLRVEQVDLADRIIYLDAGTTKNDESRRASMTADCYTLLSACVHGKKPSDRVFTREDGSPVLDFRQAWWTACVGAGVGRWEDGKYVGLLFHDLRRTGVRNMIRSGIDEHLAMKISGHKTRSVFERYNIHDQSDFDNAARLMDERRARVTCPQFGEENIHSSFIAAPSQSDGRGIN
jgi:integrase